MKTRNVTLMSSPNDGKTCINSFSFLRMFSIITTRTKEENDWLGDLLKSSIFVVQMTAAPRNLPEVYWYHKM